MYIPYAFYIPHHYNYSTSTGDVREICDTECNTGDCLLMGWPLCILIGVLIFFFCITKEMFK